MPVIACATQSVTTSASLEDPLAVGSSRGRDHEWRRRPTRQQVEIGEHRGPSGRRHGHGTADFDRLPPSSHDRD